MARVTLGAWYLDAIVEDKTVVRPTLINRVPENGETGVPITGSIAGSSFPLTIWVTDPGAAGLADITVVNITSIPSGGGAPTLIAALTRPAGFHATYAASSTFVAGMSPGSGVTDEHRITLIRNFPWTSGEIVTVQVIARVSDVAPGGEVTFNYTFTVQDLTAPYLIAATSFAGLATARLTFSEPMLQSGGGAAATTAVRQILGGVAFAAPNLLRANAGNFVAADIGRFVGVVGCDDVRGDGYYRVDVVNSSTEVQVTAIDSAALPFTPAVAGPAATVSIGPYLLRPHRVIGFQDPLPMLGEVPLGEHVLTGSPTALTTEWYWLDAGTASTLRAVRADYVKTRTPRFLRHGTATYTPATLATAATTSPNTITLVYSEVAGVPQIVVSVSAVAVGTFLVTGPVVPVPEVQPQFTPVVLQAIAPAATAVPSGINPATLVDLTLSSELTGTSRYEIGAVQVTDLAANAVLTPGVTVGVGFTRTARLLAPPAPTLPALRRFSFFQNLMPAIARDSDVTHDLEKFLAVLQETFDLVQADSARFSELWDPDLAPAGALDTLLQHLGNPFGFAYELTADAKRRLIEVLTRIYQRVGTDLGMEAVLAFFFGQAFQVRAFLDIDAWQLDVDRLDFEAILGPDTQFALYSFEVVSPIALTAVQRQQVGDIVEFMKPAHTHYVRLVEPPV
mgnify:CR=1 FL=1